MAVVAAFAAVPVLGGIVCYFLYKVALDTMIARNEAVVMQRTQDDINGYINEIQESIDIYSQQLLEYWLKVLEENRSTIQRLPLMAPKYEAALRDIKMRVQAFEEADRSAAKVAARRIMERR